MSNSKINIISNVVLPIFVIALTTILFFMFQPEEPTTLFYLNWGYVVFLEVVFFGYMNFVFRKRVGSLSTPFYAIFGVYSFYYVLTGVIWLLLFSLAIAHFAPVKVYVAGIVLLTLLWIILSLLTAQTDSNYKQFTDQLADRRQSTDLYTRRMNMLYNRYKQICKAKFIGDDGNKTEINNFKFKLNTLSPNIFSNSGAVSQLNSILDTFEQLIDQMEDAGDENIDELNKKTIRFAESAVGKLDTIKNMVRK